MRCEPVKLWAEADFDVALLNREIISDDGCATSMATDSGVDVNPMDEDVTGCWFKIVDQHPEGGCFTGTVGA